MKLVRESLNRFERGIDPKTSLGIGPRVVAIKKLFTDLNIPDNHYKIMPDGVIYDGYLFLNNLNVVWLPDNLKVKHDLYLMNTPISELPNGLNVGSNLYLSGTNITKLPDDLQVGNVIFVNRNQMQLINNINNSRFKEKIRFYI